MNNSRMQLEIGNFLSEKRTKMLSILEKQPLTIRMKLTNRVRLPFNTFARLNYNKLLTLIHLFEKDTESYITNLKNFYFIDSEWL